MQEIQNMAPNNYFEQAIKNALKGYFAENDAKDKANRIDCFNFKSYKIVGYDVRKTYTHRNYWLDIDQTVVVYDLLITYKAKKYENNCIAFEMDVCEDGSIYFKYNGRAYMTPEKDGKVEIHNHSVAYGSWTPEMATAWLNRVADRFNKKKIKGEE